MAEFFYNARKEIFVVGSRMGGYKNRHKFLAMKEKSANSKTAATFQKTLPQIIAPKSLVLEISYPEEDHELPKEFPVDRPGVVLKEVCIETGKVFSQFQMSLEEAKSLMALLAENLGE